MTESPIAPPPSGNPFESILQRFWGFDKLIGSSLIKIIYYAGLIAIGLTALGVLGAGLMRGGFAGLVGGLFVAALIVVFGAVFWRFYCEIFILLFQIYNRLGEIRDRLPPAK